MKYNRLGESELLVSEIGLGCMSLDVSNENLSIQIVQQAFDSGVNYFDTANVYDKGENEILVGKALRSFRQKVVIASKVGNQWKEDGTGMDWMASKSHILQEVDQSLRRLKTDYIDLYQLHGGTKEDQMDEIVDVFEELIKAGKIRYYGISSIRPNVFLEYAEKSNIVSNMMQFSILDRRPLPYVDQLEAHHVSVVARGSLAQGLLIDKSPKDYLIYTKEQVADLQDKIRRVSDKYGYAPASIALAYVLTQKVVSSAVLGASSQRQLSENIDALNGVSEITEEQLSKVISDLSEIRYTDHLD